MQFVSQEEKEAQRVEFNKLFPYKIELHLHLDGAVRPETVYDIAQERVKTKEIEPLPQKSPSELKEVIIQKEPCSLEKFLIPFGIFTPVLKGCRKAIYRIAYEICEDCAQQNIKYAEVRYSPHFLARSRTDPNMCDFDAREVVKTVNEAIHKGMKDFNVKINTILCCITHRPDWVPELLELCKEFKDQGVVGIDQAAQEFMPGADPATCPFKKAFQEAAKCGIHRTVHAGEVGTSQAVVEALDHFKTERIGHGYHSLDDPEVYQRVIKEQIHLEICPISSVITRACSSDIQQHPLKKFVKDGVNFSINTDDPIILGNTLTDDYLTCLEMGLSNDDIIKGIFNAARSSFASPEDKKKMLEDLTAIYGPH